MSETFTLRDGRTLGFASHGGRDSDRAVFYFHGSGGSRLEHPTDRRVLSDLGVRFIATDRPGHGLSSPQPSRTLRGWASDVRELADHLGLARFHVMGWSAGGPHALACARWLPERVASGAVVSGLGPRNRPHPYKGLPPAMKVVNFLGRNVPSLVGLFRRVTCRMLMGDPDEVARKLAASFPPPDRLLVQQPDYRRMLMASIQEGYGQGWRGPAQDDLVVNAPWGFRLEDITVPMHFWQGALDENVPVEQGTYQHERTPGSTLTVLPGQAHLYLLSHWHDVLGRLVAAPPD